jgi:hypothetical protein
MEINYPVTLAGLAPTKLLGSTGFLRSMSSLAIDLAMEQLLADDEYLPEEERRLRKNVRSAGQVGTLVGGVAAGLMGGFGGLAATPAILGVGVAAGAYYLLQEDENLPEP